MEENANLVVRLLIRRPECLGPALRGESGGGGLLKAMKYGIVMSEQVSAHVVPCCRHDIYCADLIALPYAYGLRSIIIGQSNSNLVYSSCT